jgi:hypothetical protein
LCKHYLNLLSRISFLASCRSPLPRPTPPPPAAQDAARGLGFTLEFVPQKQAVRQGHQGLTHVGREGEEMFYYFIPRHAVTGTVVLDGQTHAVAGNGWYDHEFGGTIKPAGADDDKPAESGMRMSQS